MTCSMHAGGHLRVREIVLYFWRFTHGHLALDRTEWRYPWAHRATKCPNFRGCFSKGSKAFDRGHYGGFPGQMNTERSGQMTIPSHTRETRMFLGMEAVVASEPMRELLGTIERVARSMATVLITGESGSGKELIARAVHHYSPRSHKPWVD